MNTDTEKKNAENSIRKSGILCSITSLPSSYGIGDMGVAAYKFIDWLVSSGQTLWSILPINPTSFGNSPYQSLSAFAGNPYLISPETLVKKGLLTKDVLDVYDFGIKLDDIDYGKIFWNRLKMLRRAHSNFAIQKMDKTKAYNDFCEANCYWLEDYAAFMVIKEKCGFKPWSKWEPFLRNRIEPEFSIYLMQNQKDLAFWRFVQYEFFFQWNELKKYADKKGLDIIGDLPFYISPDSADVWTHKELFAVNKETGVVHMWAGVPADMFSAKDRNWGNPVYNWEMQKAENYEWFRQRIAFCGKLYNILRIDHVIALMKFFGICSNEKFGKWYDGPDAKEKQLSIVIDKEAKKSNLEIIVEDLGVVPLGLREVLGELGWSGMRVMQFAFVGKYKATSNHLPFFHRPDMVIYAGTHDNPTIEEFLSSKTEDELRYLMYWTKTTQASELRWSIIEEAFKSTANKTIISLQDILGLGEEMRMVFGENYERSWRWRLNSFDMLDVKVSERLKTLAVLTGRLVVSEDEFVERLNMATLMERNIGNFNEPR